MTRQTLIACAFLIPFAASALPAFAEDGEACTEASSDKWLSEDAAKAKATELGYQVRDLKVEGSCFEIYAMDKDGKRAQLVMDPTSGKIVDQEEGDE